MLNLTMMLAIKIMKQQSKLLVYYVGSVLDFSTLWNNIFQIILQINYLGRLKCQI